MSQLLGRPTEADFESLRLLWSRGPPLAFRERFGVPEDSELERMCDGCEERLQGSAIRFHCLECDDFDFCASCHETALSTHAAHPFAQFDGLTPAKDMDNYILGPRHRSESISLNRIYYIPLDTKIHEIRLIALLPGADEDDIICKIAHAPLFAKLDFEALSYTWGDQRNPATIQIDDASVQVGQNLAAALRALRQSDKARYLWIDALCINQSDDEEKSHEVQRMRHIYRYATRVVIFLGEAADGSDDAMELANNQPLGNVLWGTPTHWDALDRLVRRTWWQRVWCLQEAVVPSKSPRVVCGRRSASWMGLHDACRKLPDYWRNTGATAGEQYVLENENITFRRHASIRGQYSDSVTKFNLLYLLYMTLAWEATDPRDKVYAIIGLCRSQDRDALLPDYTLNTREVYERTARHLMERDLNLLSLNTNSPRTAPFGGRPLPSWVPDWGLGASRPPPLWREGCYRASNAASDTRYVPALFPSDDPDVLRVVGVFVDRVKHVSAVITADATWLERERTGFYETIRMIESFVRECFPARPDLDVDRILDPKRTDCIWRTLIADKEYPQYSWYSPASDGFGEAYRYYREWAWGRQTYDEKPAEDAEAEEPAVGAKVEEADEDEEWEDIPDSDESDEDEEDGLPSHTSVREEQNYCLEALPSLAKYTLNERRVFLTEGGLIGICSKDVESDDIVVILAGGDVPYILRGITSEQHGEDLDGRLRLISEAYVHRAMDGTLYHALQQQTIFAIA